MHLWPFLHIKYIIFCMYAWLLAWFLIPHILHVFPLFTCCCLYEVHSFTKLHHLSRHREYAETQSSWLC